MASRKYTTRRNNGEKKQTNGIIGLVLIIISVFCLICLVIAPLLSAIGYAIRGMLLGIFGYFAYPLFVSLLVVGISLLRSMKLRFSGKNIALLCATVVTLFFLLQTITSGGITGSIDEYIAKVWDSGNTVGGLLFGIPAFAIQSIMTKVGAVIFYIALILIFAALLFYSALIASGVITVKSKKEREPKQFVHGSAPARVQTVRNSGLYVDTIIPKPPTEPDNYVVTEQGEAGKIRPQEKSVVDKYSDKKPEFDRSDLPPEKQKAHQILFGDKKSRTLDNSSPFSSYGSSSSSSYGSSSRSSFHSGSRAGYEEQMQIFKKLSENTIPDASEKPEPAPVSKPQKTDSSDSLIPEKDISSQYVGGYIINGDEVSAQFQKHEEPNEDFYHSSDYHSRDSVSEEKKPSYEVPYVREPADDRPPIINGDFYTRKPREETRRNNVPESRPQTSRPVQEDKPVKEPDATAITPPEERHDARKLNEEVVSERFEDLEDRQKKVEESIDRLIQADKSIRDYLNNRNTNEEDEEQEKGFGIDVDDDEAETFDIEPVKPINPTVKEFGKTEENSEPESFDFSEDTESEPEQETSHIDASGIINGDEFDATKGFNVIDEVEDLSENDAPRDDNSGYYEKVDEPFARIASDNNEEDDSEPEEAEEKATEEPDETTEEEAKAEPESEEANDSTEADGVAEESAEMDSRFAQMQSYVNSVKPKKDKVSENQIGIEEYMADNAVETNVVYSIKSRYTPPPLNLLQQESTDYAKLSGDTEKNSSLMEEVLESFKFPAKVMNVVPGPAVTRYELEIPRGVPIKKIEEHAADIAYELAVQGKIRIETPIPGKKAVGVEVPNKEVGIVGLRDIISSKEFKTASSPLTLALGKDIAGEVILCNLEKMPHLLIAGSTNSGKSSCLNSIIMSIIYKASPEDVRIILIDPKQVEFSAYMGAPHLLINDIVKETEEAVNCLKWAIDEMEHRYSLFSANICRNIKEYNALEAVQNGTMKKIPYIVIIIDEFSALMGGKNKDLEEKIIKIAQKSRASGIHLILATQRPSVDVITGTIKANLPSRIAFAVTSYNDSKTILDKGGAETLVGRGDMLYAPIDNNQPKRVQGAYIEGDEITNIIAYARSHNKCTYYDDAEKIIKAKAEDKAVDIKDDEEGEAMDPLIPDVLKCIIASNQVSATLIQRRFSVGYARAARILDQMEMHKFVSPPDSRKIREIYITKEMYEKLFGSTI